MSSSLHVLGKIMRNVLIGVCLWAGAAGIAAAQGTPPPAYLAVVEGNATLERDGEIFAAVQNMPFVPGDRLRTTDGRVQIVFPDGTAIEIAEDSAVESVSPTRVRLLAGTMDHVQRVITESQSATYLPQELDTYGATLDQSGTWQYDAPYGYVWYPAVPATWRPYYNGYWSTLPAYGWTWIGLDSWAWPTHHYGRWGYLRNRWFWIPGRSWGPAWVSWGSAPGYVSWCPLGVDGRPVFGLTLGYGNPWRGWTILPRGSFGRHGFFAHRNAVDPRRLPPNASFVARTGPPASPARIGRTNAGNAPTVGVAVPRRPTPRTQPPTRPGPGAPGTNSQTPTTQAGPDPLNGTRRAAPSVETHYGTPRQMAPASGAPGPAPGSRATPQNYQPPVPGYQAPGGYAGQRMAPRVMVPPAEAPPSPMAVPRTPPAGTMPMTTPRTPPAGATPMATPRTAPAGTMPTATPRTPPADATPMATPPASAPTAAPATARPMQQSAPQRGSQGQGASQGQAGAQGGEGRPAGSRRPR